MLRAAELQTPPTGGVVIFSRPRLMRLASRVVSTLLVAVVVATCSESPTNVRPGAVSLALAPRFSAEAQAIYRSLAAFAVTLDNVHIVVRAQSVGDALGAVLKDTLVAFPATADQIAIVLDLQITGTEQRVVATVDLQSGSTVYFEGTQDLVARVGDTPTVAEPIAMNYALRAATRHSDRDRPYAVDQRHVPTRRWRQDSCDDRRQRRRVVRRSNAQRIRRTM